MLKIYRFLSKKYLIIITKFQKHVYLTLGKDAYLPHNSEIKTAVEIGDGTGINGPIRILGGAKVSIGKYCAIGSGVKISSSNHDISKANLQAKLAMDNFKQSLDVIKGNVIIGNNVWIGDSAIILPGVSIGHGAVIGAGTIVTKPIPPFGVAVGNPGKIIKYRFSQNIINQLLKISWWDWPQEKIKMNKEFFHIDLTKNSSLRLSSFIK